jgi:peptidoglycan/LPS O-acetylase OafA/YrhL
MPRETSVLVQSEASASRQNNFNLLRIVAAAAVAVSHAFPISSGPGAHEPLSDVIGMTLGTLGVSTFFAISGYFISSSFHNRRSALEFAVARTLRIYPGLILMLVLTVLVLGPVFTEMTLVNYLADKHTLLYVPKNMALWPLQYDLPGVFAANPYPRTINGSLWTLIYEVACYFMVALVGIVGLTRTKWRFAIFLIGYATWYALVIPLLQSGQPHLTLIRNFHELSLPFVAGMTLFHLRLGSRLPILLCLVFVAVLSYGRSWFTEVFILAWSYGVIYVGFLQWAPLLVYNRLGDYSYGMYIYGFPVEQSFAALYRGLAPATVMLLSIPLTLLLAALSWHGVEQHALTQKSKLARRLTAQLVRMKLSTARSSEISAKSRLSDL